MKPSIYPIVWAGIFLVFSIINKIADNDVYFIGNLAMVHVWLAAAWLDGRRLQGA